MGLQEALDVGPRRLEGPGSTTGTTTLFVGCTPNPVAASMSGGASCHDCRPASVADRSRSHNSFPKSFAEVAPGNESALLLCGTGTENQSHCPRHHRSGDPLTPASFSARGRGAAALMGPGSVDFGNKDVQMYSPGVSRRRRPDAGPIKPSGPRCEVPRRSSQPTLRAI